LTNIFKNLEAQVKKTFKLCNENSVKTRERYENGMKSFAKFLANTYRKQNIEKISNTHIKAYVDFLQGSGKSTSTVTTNLSAIRYFYSKRIGIRFKIMSNRQLGVNARTNEERIGEDRAMSDKEYEYFLDKCDEKNEENYKILMQVGDQLGLRISECFKMRHSQLKVAIKTSNLAVKGKGGYIRNMELDDLDIKLLEKVNSIKTSGTDRIFVKKNEKTHIKIKELQTFIYKNREDDKITFHSLRHRYAQNKYDELRAKGLGDFEARMIVSHKLGHNRLEICKIYLNN
jgi:site-specific recombinase XerC